MTPLKRTFIYEFMYSRCQILFAHVDVFAFSPVLCVEGVGVQNSHSINFEGFAPEECDL